MAVIDESNIIKAPWTTEQVEGLNRYQKSGMMHEYTCSKKGDCREKYSIASTTLIATTDGWVCQCGEYKQDWAHADTVVTEEDVALWNKQIEEIRKGNINQ